MISKYFRIIGDHCALNYGDRFDKAFLEIYPTELVLKVEYNGIHATFLNLGFSIVEGKFIFNIFDMTNGTSLTFILLECHQLQFMHRLSFFIVPLC